MSASRRYAGVPVLVTGAQGFIGSWLAARLREAGATVVQPDRGDLDVTDASAVGRLLAEHEVRAVFHLAAQSTVERAYRDPLGTLDVNIRGTYSVLEACRRSPLVKQVVFASSDKAYGDHDELHKGVPRAINADGLVMTVKADKAVTIKLEPTRQKLDPEGKASVFTAKHAVFSSGNKLSGTISGKVGTKPYSGDFKQK